ncbi:T6SS phospholipase effector Tle1-like catalytic domain-containing protein [Aquisalimonas asiatica]|uniref:Uncharacterized alpha/beta hydrolase domain n=1 Tax=Aquisalimonas asiatica TaxID=406100 RepID=A0A1H8VXH2_9GAMM|nr:DUF2235 domain-containing protein [Aquisalimonas asiatica]SEP20004.1 Uncharacterized alpha/beta hydrolase domain [Aquisalimonas asiatica]
MASPNYFLQRRRRELEQHQAPDPSLNGPREPSTVLGLRSPPAPTAPLTLQSEIRLFQALNPPECHRRRIEHLPLDIRSRVTDWRQCYVVDRAEARRLRRDAQTQFFVRRRGRWQEMGALDIPVLGDDWVAVRRMQLPGDGAAALEQPSSPATPASEALVASFYPLNENSSQAEGEFRVRLRGYEGAEPRRLTLISQHRSIQRNIDADGDRSVRFGGLQPNELYSLRVSGNGLASQYLFRDVPSETLRRGGDALRSHLRDNGLDATAHVLDHDKDARDTVTLTIAVDPPQFGAFFDGTGNNLYNDAKRDDRAPTNVGKLSELHPGDDEALMEKVYSIGVGGDADGPLDLADRGIAFSFGRRIQEVIGELRRFSGQFPLALSVVIDVFGFSRGAAQARTFVNQVRYLTVNEPGYFAGSKPVFRFAGLFDTVGSIGIPGNGSNDNPIAARGLHTGIELGLAPDSVQRVVHLTAYHEKRGYYPSTSLRTGPDDPLPDHFEEQVMPGVHADVGGGYPDQPDVVHYPAVVLRNLNERRRDATIDAHLERLHERFHAPGLDIQADVREMVSRGDASNWYVLFTWERDIDPSLAHYPLEIMHAAAVESGVPLKGLERLGGMGHRYKVSDELRDLLRRVEAEGMAGDAHDALYRRYVHHSHQYAAPRSHEEALALDNAGNTNRTQRGSVDHPAENGVRGVYYPPPADPVAAEPIIEVPVWRP